MLGMGKKEEGGKWDFKYERLEENQLTEVGVKQGPIC